MADNKFYIKMDDTRPYLRVSITDENGDVVDISGSSVKFNMVTDDNDRTSKVNASADLVTATSGVAEYRWSASDTDTAGKYLGEFQITLADTTIFSIPKDDSLKIIVKKDYGD